MLDKIALLCIFSDADIRKLPNVLAATVGPETEILYLRLSTLLPVSVRNMIAKAIQNVLSDEEIRVDVKTVTDRQIHLMDAYHNWVQSRLARPKENNDA